MPQGKAQAQTIAKPTDVQMGNLVITIRGTMGSGKSTIVKELLSSLSAQPILHGNRIRGHVCLDVFGKPLHVLGPYNKATGGCDNIGTQDEVCNLVRQWAGKGNLLFEGLLISGLFARYNALDDELAEHHFIHGFLDTPLDKCIDRVLARRAAKGNTKPFDPYRTLVPKYEAVRVSRRKFEAAGGPNCECCKAKPCNFRKKDVQTVPHLYAVETVMTWLETG